jgi:hypothetical protein
LEPQVAASRVRYYFARGSKPVSLGPLGGSAPFPMNESDKRLAEAVISRLCQGAQIDGIRFGPILQILISDHSSEKPPIDGQVYLNLGSSWMLTEGAPASMPVSEDDFPQRSAAGELEDICAIREQTIVWTRLGNDSPNLFLGLESGKVFCVNGRHDQYEAWELGVALGKRDEVWLVVACPGNEVSVWAPPGFTAGSVA